MGKKIKWELSRENKDTLMRNLTPELNSLRKKAEISQGDLANIIGVSRQTYSAIERRVREMTWSTYLSLIFFFDYNIKTHDMIRSMGVFPKDIMLKFNDNIDTSKFNSNIFFDEDVIHQIGYLDNQALSSIKTLIMIEYARCTHSPVKDVLRESGEDI